ncbi:hypothetical protein OROMI_022620 [Orobanche minor]
MEAAAPLQTVGSPVESWVFSSASCYHVTQHRELLENYTSGSYGKVYLLTGETMDVIGKGDVRIKLSDNVTWTLHDVKHIPGHIWNLISVSQLMDSGKKDDGIIFSRDGVKVMKGDFAFTVPNDPNAGNRVTYLSASPPCHSPTDVILV